MVHSIPAPPHLPSTSASLLIELSSAKCPVSPLASPLVWIPPSHHCSSLLVFTIQRLWAMLLASLCNSEPSEIWLCLWHFGSKLSYQKKKKSRYKFLMSNAFSILCSLQVRVTLLVWPWDHNTGERHQHLWGVQGAMSCLMTSHPAYPRPCTKKKPASCRNCSRQRKDQRLQSLIPPSWENCTLKLRSIFPSPRK